MKRLESLDVVRGMTVAGMILVNNGTHSQFSMLGHEPWNGLSFSDLVFPFFLFIMGVSMYLSMSKRGNRLDGPMVAKIVKRTAVLFLIGLGINWLELGLHADFLNFEGLRFWAVLQRIALCYFIVSLTVLMVPARYTSPLAWCVLAVYGVIMIVGDAYSTDPSANIISRVDIAIFGDSHLYHRSPVDPEGLVSTLGSLANVLFGYYAAFCMSRAKSVGDKCRELLFLGAVLTFFGFLVNFGLPYNKHVWSPSFALVTSGFCSLLLGIVMTLVDMRHKKGPWVDCFRIFGVNALALYVTSELIAIFCGHWGISSMLWQLWDTLIPVPQLASLGYSLTFVAVNFAIGYPLWRKSIYIKL